MVCAFILIIFGFGISKLVTHHHDCLKISLFTCFTSLVDVHYFIGCTAPNISIKIDLSVCILGGELFMHLEREGIFMEDTAWCVLDTCIFKLFCLLCLESVLV